MRRFKLQRMKYEENQKLLERIKRAKKHKVKKGKISKFFHTANQKFLSENIKPLANHPSFKSLILPSTFSDTQRMKMIDFDFENCISNNIMSSAAILRQKRRFKGRYLGLKGNGWASRLIKEAPVDSINQSLKLLRRVDSSMKKHLSSSITQGVVLNVLDLERENHINNREIVVVERGDDASDIFKTDETISNALAGKGLGTSP